MTDLVLRGNATLESGFAFFRRLLKEMFRATPLGMALAMRDTRR
jgi:hypothetical protein